MNIEKDDFTLKSYDPSDIEQKWQNNWEKFKIIEGTYSVLKIIESVLAIFIDQV